jgi:hypothetical protein
VTDGVVVGDCYGGRLSALYEQYGQPRTGCDRVLTGRPARRRWFPAYLCYRVLALLCALLVHHLISHVLSYRNAAGWLEPLAIIKEGKRSRVPCAGLVLVAVRRETEAAIPRLIIEYKWRSAPKTRLFFPFKPFVLGCYHVRVGLKFPLGTNSSFIRLMGVWFHVAMTRSRSRRPGASPGATRSM